MSYAFIFWALVLAASGYVSWDYWRGMDNWPAPFDKHGPDE